MNDEPEAAAPHLVRVTDEMLEVSLLLPGDWTVEVTPGSSQLVCVPGEDPGHDGLRPSITVQRLAPVDWPTVLSLASSTLSQMQSTYADFVLRWADDEPEAGRILRAYDFTLSDRYGSVHQVQGLVLRGALFLVNCTEPIAGETDDDTFVTVIRSLSEL